MQIINRLCALKSGGSQTFEKEKEVGKEKNVWTIKLLIFLIQKGPEKMNKGLFDLGRNIERKNKKLRQICFCSVWPYITIHLFGISGGGWLLCKTECKQQKEKQKTK